MSDERSPDSSTQGDRYAMDDVERYRSASRLLAAGDPHSSLQVLQPLLDQEQDNPALLLMAARAAFDSAQLARAEELFSRLVQLDPADHYAHAGLGRTLQRRRRHREAIPHLRIAGALSPEPWYVEALKRAEEAVAAEGPAEVQAEGPPEVQAEGPTDGPVAPSDPSAPSE